MSDEREFRIRLGRIRSTRAQQARPFIAQALAAAQKAGGRISSGKITSGNRSRFGRGQRASIQANRLLSGRSRIVVIKTRVVRHTARSALLGAHLNYLRHDGATRDGEKARMFGPEIDDMDAGDFAERCQDDRHHFRFIVSPEDAVDMTDLKAHARELMGQMEKDLGTRLDWVALAVRSDLDLGAQVGATGATWLDRQAIAREPIALSDSGFGAEVRQALDERAEHLIGEGLAERQGQDGRFAMIDDGLGFQLVPWSPSLEKQIGRHVSGVARDDGGVDWEFGRKRGLGL